MSIRPPRRIFRPSIRRASFLRSSTRSVRVPRPDLVAAVLCAAGVGVVLAGLAPSLFGKPPVVTARITAGADDVAVVDGETLRLNGVTVRLAGIRAPARGEECRPGVDCGAAASRSLADIVRNRSVRCDLQDTGGGRPVGLCFAGSDELSRGVVAQGWARTDRADLHEPERQARDARRGLWAATP